MTNNGHEPLPAVIVGADPAAMNAPVPVQQVPLGWKEQLAKWLVNQSVSTVLLIAILASLIYGFPTVVIPTMQAGYERNVKALEKIADQYQQSQKERDIMVEKMHDRDRRVWERMANSLEGKKP